MIVETRAVGALQGNCIILGDEESREAMVIDPGDEPDVIVDAVRRHGLHVKYIVCTHGHFDHVGAVGDIKAETGGLLVMHSDEREIYAAALDMAAFWGFRIDPLPPPDTLVSEGDTLTLGKRTFQVIHTPGHSPGGICLYGENIVITGDTLFAGSVGRTDFHGGDMGKLKSSFRRLMDLPDRTVVLSGHGPETTIGREKRENLFAEEFL